MSLDTLRFPLGDQFPIDAGDPHPLALAAGSYFLAFTTTDATPSSVSAFSTITTKFNDVGSPDHTTYEEATGATLCTLKGLWVFSSNVTIQSYVASVFSVVPAGVVYYGTDGVSWSTWDTPVLGAGASHAWQDISRNPTDQTAKYVQFVLSDNATVFDPPAVARIGDWRITSA